MSGGSQNTTGTTAPGAAVQPYYNSALTGAQNLLNTGGPQYYTGQTVAPLNATQNQGLSSITGAAGAPNASTSAQTANEFETSGALLNPSNNPYLAGTFNQAADQVQSQLSSEFAGAGSNVINSLPVQSDEMNNLATQLYGGAYNTGLQAETQASALAPSIDAGTYLPGQNLLGAGQVEQNTAQNQDTAAQAAYNYNSQLPMNMLSWYSGLLGENASPTKTTTGTVSGSPNSGLQTTGALLTGLGALGGTSGLSGLLGSASSSTGLLGALASLFPNSNYQNPDGSLQTVTPYTNDLSGGLTNPDGSLNLNYLTSPTEGVGNSLDDYLSNFSGAGGQATTAGGTDASGASASSNVLGSLGSGLGTAGGLLGIASGLSSGTPTGQASAALSAASLANKAGLLGTPSSSVGSALGGAGGALGLYSGLQQGGTVGDLSAASGAARLGSSAASLAGDSGLASGLGDVAGGIAIPLSAYNLVKTYQSGATGSDALSGAETGASVGSLFGPIGTGVGALIGGAVGGIASAFGGGKNDPESLAGNSLDKAITAGTANDSALSSPSNAFQYLAGAMDAKNDTAGHSQPIEQVFGRMGESNLTNSMFDQINSAIGSGAFTPTADGGISVKTGGGTVTYNANDAPTYIYNNVVAPWLQSQGAGISSSSTDLNGNNQGNQLISSLQSLIGAWQTGGLTSSTPIGVSGQADSSLPTYA